MNYLVLKNREISKKKEKKKKTCEMNGMCMCIHTTHTISFIYFQIKEEKSTKDGVCAQSGVINISVVDIFITAIRSPTDYLGP